MYSGLLILFLTLFVVIVFVVLYMTILQSSENELKSLISQEANFIENYLIENDQHDLRDVQNQEIVFAGVNQAFYYVINSKGDITMGNENESRLRPSLLKLFNEKMINESEVFIEKFHLEGTKNSRGKFSEFRHPEPQKDIRMMIASEPIYYNGQFIGTLYIGKDISFAYQLFYWVFIILVVLGVLFYGVAIFISHKMSKKAMVPITNAFTRQREFLADASHELRTPLAVMLSSIDAMDMTFETDQEDYGSQLLTNMRQGVKRMTNLVSDLLTLARSDSNTVELRSEHFDFRPLVEKAVTSLQPLTDEKQLSTSLSAPTTIMFNGDPERLSQLLYILLDNAIKYTPRGGAIRLFLSKEGPNLCIAVEDTGIGIKKENFERIFDRFYRIDESRSRQIGGHGLGLSIAKWIVETHHGTIKVDSQLSKGTTFFVLIPDAKEKGKRI